MNITLKKHCNKKSRWILSIVQYRKKLVNQQFSTYLIDRLIPAVTMKKWVYPSMCPGWCFRSYTTEKMQKSIIKTDIAQHIIWLESVRKKINKICRNSKPFEFDPSLSASSAEASERSSSALISAFVFSCGIEQSANVLSWLSLQVLHSFKHVSEAYEQEIKLAYKRIQ